MAISGLKLNSKRLGIGLFLAMGLFWAGMPSTALSQQDNLSLDVTLLDGGTSIDFGSLRSLNPSGEAVVDSSLVQVRIRVDTALNRPYIVTQTLNSDIVNQDGAALPDGTIRFRAQIEQGSGLVTTTEMAPLRQETQEIFLSDDNGGSVTLLLIYELTLPKGQSAGRYFNAINYQVNVR